MSRVDAETASTGTGKRGSEARLSGLQRARDPANRRDGGERKTE